MPDRSEATAFVYRAITDAAQITRDGKVKRRAFHRRGQFRADGQRRDRWDPSGLSVYLTPRAALAAVPRAVKIAKLSLAGLELIGLGIDEPEAHHANIQDVPFYEGDDRERADIVAGLIANCVEELLDPANL